LVDRPRVSEFVFRWTEDRSATEKLNMIVELPS
jgi:hypothetical protein